MKLMKSAALVGAVAVAAGLVPAGSAQAQAEPARAAACNNTAWLPYWSPGYVHGDVQRDNVWCGNANVVANVYKETGWRDSLAASRASTFAVGGMTATGRCLGTGEYYTQIRINGVTAAQSDHKYIWC